MSVRSPGSIGPFGRTVAALLAVVWIGMGSVGVWLGATRRSAVPVIAGIAAVAYGLLYVRVVRVGRKLRWPLR